MTGPRPRVRRIASGRRAAWALGVVALVGLAAGCDNTGIRVATARARPTKAFPHPWPKPAPTSKPSAELAAAEMEASGVGAAPLGGPVVAAPQPASYALIIGIERYRDIDGEVLGARADAERMQELFRETLGLRESSVRVALGERATRADLEAELEWLAEATPPGGRAYLHFSGHGAPDPDSGDPYLVPYDGNPARLEQTAIGLERVLGLLARSRAKEVLVTVDACFTGTGERSVLAEGARPLVRVREVTVQPKVALFAGAGATEISGSTPDSDAGLFTDTVLSGLGSGTADSDGDGQVSLRELTDYVTPRVARVARELGRDQTPTLSLPDDVSPESFIVAYGYPPR